jgi:cysteine desulfurase
LAIKGVVSFSSKEKKHVITLQTEHKCVLDSCRVLQQKGVDVTYLGVDSKGLVNVDEFKAAIRPDTVLASVMFVNNEIGVIQPIQELASICREHGV